MPANNQVNVAIVTGAAGSLGRAVAARLRADDWALALVDRDQDQLYAVQQALGLDAANSRADALDLTVQPKVDEYVEIIAREFGPIAVLVNVAGGFAFGGPTQDMDLAIWDTMMTANVKTALLMSAAVVRSMIAYQTNAAEDKPAARRIINVASRAALTGAAGLAAYSASKAALLRLTESMAAELITHNITVNAILPSTIDTPANRQAMPKADPDKWVTPESLAGVVAFLASPAARDISGAAIPVYGKA